MVFKIVRGKEGIQMDDRIFRSKGDAQKQMRFANKEFEEFNKLISQGKIKRKPIGLVRVVETSFSRKKNVGFG